MPRKKLEKQSKEITTTTEIQETRPSIGIGDTIEKITKKTGVKKLVNFIAGEDCGCEERKAKLNKMFLYKKPRCLWYSEYEYLKEFQTIKSPVLSKDEADQIAKIWNDVFQTKKFYRPCTCDPKLWQEMVNDLIQVYNTYEIEQ